MKEIYLIRHSETLRTTSIENSDSLQTQNEKRGLTIHGEALAKEKSERKIFKNFDIVISSNYVRATSTAKYFAKDSILIDENFNERKFGVDNWENLPKDFEERQWNDFNYKLPNGESLNEVIERQYNSLMHVLEMYPNKKILIVGHSTSFASLFSKWCEIDFNGYKFKGETFFDGNWNYCESFKLIFDDDNNLVDIKNLK